MACVLAVDVGSSAVKAAVWTGRRFTPMVREAYATQRVGVRAEVTPGTLLRALTRAVGEACRRTGTKPEVVAIDVFSTGLIVLDERFRPLTPIITHQDRRSVAEAGAYERDMGAAWLLKTAGNRPFPGGIGASTLAWLAEQTPAVLSRRVRVGQASSFLMHALTGEWTIDPSQAAFLGLMTLRTREWNGAICERLRVPLAHLPAIRPGDQVLGRLRGPVARRLGLTPGLPAVGGIVDTGAAVLATPMQPGQLVHNAGSTDVLALCLDHPRPAADILTRPLGTGATLPEITLAASTIAAAGAAVTWARQTFFADLTEKGFAELMLRTCRGIVAGHRPAGVGFVPHLAGDRTSMEPVAGALTGLTLGTGRGDLLAAIVGALTEASRMRYLRLAALHHVLPTVRTMGGRSDLASAMHAVWPARHTFAPIAHEALPGLVRMAEAALGGGDRL